MKYDFDKSYDRHNTNCVKWDLAKEDVLPMWVADMDFEVAKPISDAIEKRAEHHVYGYSFAGDNYYNSVINWMNRRKNWNIKKEWIKFSPGIVPAINMLIKAFTEPEDEVVIQTPVYYPFHSAVIENKRKLVENSLKLVNCRYYMDYEDLEQKFKKHNVKLIILCSPHNPVGRVWSEDELIRLGNLCLKYNVKIIADEIHSDLIYKQYKFISIASINEEFADITATCTAPSKTFNLAGLQTSNVIISNDEMRKQFTDVLEANAVMEPNLFGITALEAAYNSGSEWLAQLMDYLSDNLEFLSEYINNNIPEIKVIKPEGTYLVWLDCRKLAMNKKELHDFMLDKAKVWFDDGHMFGENGKGFERINIACTKATLKEALDRIKNALK